MHEIWVMYTVIALLNFLISLDRSLELSSKGNLVIIQTSNTQGMVPPQVPSHAGSIPITSHNSTSTSPAVTSSSSTPQVRIEQTVSNKKNIVAAFRRMQVSPAKHSYAWLPRKCDYRADTGQSDPYVPLCFAGDSKIKWQNFVNIGIIKAKLLNAKFSAMPTVFCVLQAGPVSIPDASTLSTIMLSICRLALCPFLMPLHCPL